MMNLVFLVSKSFYDFVCNLPVSDGGDKPEELILFGVSNVSVAGT